MALGTLGVAPAEAAAVLLQIADKLAADVEGMEHLAAALPASPGVSDTLSKVRRQAVVLGILHAYFKEIQERPETPVEFNRNVFGVPNVEST